MREIITTAAAAIIIIITTTNWLPVTEPVERQEER